MQINTLDYFSNIFIKHLQKHIQFLILAISKKGGLAQLARALAWHARGHRFDSDILHFEIRPFTTPKGFFNTGSLAQLV